MSQYIIVNRETGMPIMYQNGPVIYSREYAEAVLKQLRGYEMKEYKS